MENWDRGRGRREERGTPVGKARERGWKRQGGLCLFRLSASCRHGSRVVLYLRSFTCARLLSGHIPNKTHDLSIDHADDPCTTSMLSSQGRHASAPRKHYESEPERSRQPMASTQRYTNEYAYGTTVPDRQPRSSRRADTSGNTLAFESAPPAHKLSSSRDQPYVRGPSHYMPPEVQAQAAASFAATAGVASSSRSRAHDQSADPDISAYGKRRTERQSPRSSQEKLLGLDQGQSSRVGQQPRSVYPTFQQSGTGYPPAAQYQPPRDPTSSSRHRKDRDRDRDEDRERRKERHREKERAREEEERLRDRIALEKELEKQRRREERRMEREKEKERERRREENERERARRPREKAKEHESRTRDESRLMNPVYPNASFLAAKYQGSVSLCIHCVLPSLTYTRAD